jgi:hypothetical protein
MIWVIVPIIAIITPFAYRAYSQWVDLQKARFGSSHTEDHSARLIDAEDALVAAQRRIENLETIVVNRLLEAPSSKDGVAEADASELIAQSTSN